MSDLFGVNISKLMADGIASTGGAQPGTLKHFVPGTRTGGSLTGGTNPVESTHTFKGWAEVGEVRRAGQVTAASSTIITILGATINPAVVPEVNDEVTIDGSTYTLTELMSRGPASAIYKFVSKE